MPKFYESEKWLRRQIVDLKRKPEDVAQQCGVTKMTIYRWMDKHKIGFGK